MSKLVTPVVIYSIVLMFCLILVKSTNKRRFDFFDPGFLFLIFVTLTFLPLSILVILGYSVEDINIYLRIRDLTLFNKTIIAHAILIASFIRAS